RARAPRTPPATTRAPASRCRGSARRNRRGGRGPASIRDLIQSVRLTVGGQEAEVTGDRFVIGRADDCGLVLDDTEVSRHHAALRALPDGRATIEDLGSINGTFVNGVRVGAPV